jgi:predicted HicB family RNase H-like nuclease
MRHLEYKSYTGSIEYSKENELLCGKVLGIMVILVQNVPPIPVLLCQ